MAEQETVRCGRCGLAQFVREKRGCRRCGVNLQKKVVAESVPIANSAMTNETKKKNCIVKVLVAASDDSGGATAKAESYDLGAALERQALKDLERPGVPLKVSVAARLVVLRRMRGHSQDSLAALAGFNRAHLGKIESMTIVPTLETLERLSVALEFPMVLVLAPMAEFTAFLETERQKGVA